MLELAILATTALMMGTTLALANYIGRSPQTIVVHFDQPIPRLTARLDQIRFEMEQGRRDAEQHQRDFEADKLTREERARQERSRFIIEMIVTSIAGLTAAVALILHLLGKV